MFYVFSTSFVLDRVHSLEIKSGVSNLPLRHRLFQPNFLKACSFEAPHSWNRWFSWELGSPWHVPPVCTISQYHVSIGEWVLGGVKVCCNMWGGCIQWNAGWYREYVRCMQVYICINYWCSLCTFRKVSRMVVKIHTNT